MAGRSVHAPRDPSDVTSGDSESASERSLEDLMDAYCKGDRQAFDELFARLAPKVNVVLLRLSRSRELAEELTQACPDRERSYPLLRLFVPLIAIALAHRRRRGAR